MRILIALALLALVLTGCESSAEKSAKLESEARAHAAAAPTSKALSIARPSTRVKVVASAVVHGSEGAAVAVTLLNTSASTIRALPLELTARDAHGATVYTNTAPGLAGNLTSVAALGPHQELTWVDDQLPAAGPPVSATARVGEGTPVAGATPQLSTAGLHLFEDPSNGVGAQGSVVNRSSIAQQELVVYVLAERGGTLAAVGRAILPLAAAGAATSFQVFFVGDPRGAQLRASAPPTTFG